MISFRLVNGGFKMRDFEPGSLAIEALAKKLTAAGAVFEMDEVFNQVVFLVAGPLPDPTRPGKTYEGELAHEVCSPELHLMHRAIERVIAKAAQRLGVK